MSAEENKAVLRRVREAWNRGDLEGYLTLYDPDTVVHGYQGVAPGLDSVRAFYQGFWASFPGNQLQFDEMVAEGDEVAVRFRVEGTHEGALMGLPPTGKAFTMPGITILRFADGRCVERWSQADFLGLLQQLGAVGR
jgi:steroid delta-isomerase-like uncharacterized protein